MLPWWPRHRVPLWGTELPWEEALPCELSVVVALSPRSFCEPRRVLMHIHLGLLRTLVLGNHVLGSISHCGQLAVYLDEGHIQRREPNAYVACVDGPHSANLA